MGIEKQINVPCKTFETFLSETNIGAIELLKVDIEGSELEMIESTTNQTLLQIGQIAIEFHDFLDANQLPRIKNILKRLKSIGFKAIIFSDYDYRAVTLLNTHLIALPNKTKFWLCLAFPFSKFLKKTRQLVINTIK